MDKKLENIAETACHYSICQNAKFNNGLISKRHMSQSVITKHAAKNASRNSSSMPFIEKHPRSYAEIIADYSKTLYKESTSIENDSIYFNNIMWQSPFSTSISPLNKKLVSSAEHDVIPTERRENHSIFLANGFNSTNRRHRKNINITECHNFQHHDTCASEVMNRNTNQEHVITNDFKTEDQSYVKLVADCNKSTHISLASTSNPGLIPSRNVLVRNSLELFGTPTRKASSANMREMLQKTIPPIATIPLGRNIKEQTSDSMENDWLREIESVISDLRTASERKTARAVNVSKLRESNVLQSADASSNALDRIQKLAELIKEHKQKEKDAEKKLGESKYFSNTTKSLSSRKNSTQVPTVSGTAGTLKQPQVELRMVPSEKESVVSINVDSASIGLSDPVNSASKQLSVIVQSDRKGDRQPSEAQWNTPTLRSSTKSASQRNDFGPMCISISEDSAPVKQIEFSINGKPVSELKSITARTERLDVVSSVDKIEIRIPFSKDDASSKTRGGDLSKQIDSSGGQILNVQIAANFQNEAGKGSGEQQPVGTINTIPTSSQIPRTHYAFNDPVRVETLSSDGAQQHGSSTWSNIRSDNTTGGDINEHETSDNVNLKIQRATSKKLSADKTMADVPLIKKATDTKVGRWNTKNMANTVSSETNKYDKTESSDPRVPSKVIPWWSSSDSFNKIRKKDDDRKPVSPTLNRNKKKAMSNLNQDLATESFPSKLKETSTPKLQTINVDSMHNAITNNSNVLISYMDSVEQHETSKASDRYLYPFRLKPNRGNPSDIPKMTRTDLKIEDSQTSGTQENNKNFSQVKQTNPVTLSTLDKTNKQDEHDINIKEKISISPENVKTSSKQNLKTQEQHSLEQTNSISGEPIKSKIENIVDVIKPIKKREDGTLIDYGLKVSSRKPIVKLSSKMEENENSIIRKKKNLLSDKYNETRQNMKHDISVMKAISKREQMDKRMSTKQTEMDEIKKVEIKKNMLKKKEDLTVKTIAGIKISESKKSNLSSSIKNSSETVPKSKQLQTSIKVPSEEPKQDRQKYLSSIKNIPRKTKISEELEKLNNLLSLQSKDNHHSSKGREISNKKIVEVSTKSNISTNKTVNTDKPSATQTKPSPTSKPSQSKDCAIPKDSNKNAEAMPTTNRKYDVIEDTIAKTITQNLKIKSSLSKDSGNNHLHKSKSNRDRKNSSESDNSPKKDSSTGSKSSGSKMCTAKVMSNNIYTCTGQCDCLYNNVSKL
ncbi:uncharacterized protein LOC113561477 [Ooceraea biroi]|uniref:uncharacterized protein LOC113561477 n=1 Tax=Ooceraea biroi TaxID=2015173 RepID=UPI000F07F7AE|nr:uncharacterized protein LOC113561477 [Ooceraea biroi]